MKKDSIGQFPKVERMFLVDKNNGYQSLGHWLRDPENIDL